MMLRLLLLLLAGLAVCVAMPTAAQDAVAAVVLPEYTPPPLEIVHASPAIMGQRDYRQVIGAIDIYDAPDGNVLRSRPAGAFFVSVVSSQGDWVEINPGEWILGNVLQPAPRSELGGILLNGYDGQTALGLLSETVFPRTAPGIEDYSPNTSIGKYRPVYVYEEQQVGDTAWVRVGTSAWIPRSSVRMVRPLARPAGIMSQHWVGVDIQEQVIIAYDGTTPVFATLVSTGTDFNPTETGIFSTYVRFNRRDMSRGDINQPWFYHMEDVPYTFYFNGNEALHGAYWHDQFGTPQSHGCVNMSLTAAYWVYDFLSQGLDVTDPNAVWPMVWIY